MVARPCVEHLLRSTSASGDTDDKARHTDADTQYTDGITGALIVHPASPPPEAFPTWDGELVVQLADLYHTFSSVLLASYLSVRKLCSTS